MLPGACPEAKPPAFPALKRKRKKVKGLVPLRSKTVYMGPLPLVGPFHANHAYSHYQELKAVRVSWFGGFSEDVSAHIFTFLNRADLRSLSDSCRYMSRLVSSRLARRFAIEDLRCFHSKRSFGETTLVLGIHVERHRDGEVKEAVPRFDLLSHECFTDYNVRQSAFNLKFTNYLPLYICPKHGKGSRDSPKPPAQDPRS